MASVWRLGTVNGGGSPRTVLEVDGQLCGLDGLLDDGSAPSVLSLLTDWDTWLPRLEDAASAAPSAQPLAGDVSWLPPVLFPPKLICMGGNYGEHMREAGGDPDAHRPLPFAFIKPSTTSLAGSGQTVVLPRPEEGDLIDWEGELAVVIGRRSRRVSREGALDVVAAYAPLNDISIRDYLFPPKKSETVGIDWVLQKAWQGATPFGPLLTPSQFVPDPQVLRLRTTVNGVVKQDAVTDMIFDVKAIVSHLSSIFTLEPGDVIATGTPHGVGLGMKPPEYMGPGDTVEVSIEGLGPPLVSPLVAA